MYPEDLKYTKDHEWLRIQGDVGVIGLTKHAVDQLGDIVSLELPAAGDVFNQNDSMALVDSMKATSEVYIPVSGEILEANEALEDEPELVNEDPYDAGWLVKLKLTEPAQVEALLTVTQYLELIKKEG